MIHQDPSVQPHVARTDRIKLLWSLALSLFWVVFMWGFFDREAYALGANAFVYLAGLIGLALWAMHREGIRLRKNLAWIIPTSLIALSFLIYDNPFLKPLCLLALTATFVLFYNDAFLAAEHRVRWSAKVVEALVWRILSVVRHVRKAGELIARLASQTKKEPGTAKRVAVGIILFFVIAIIVVIPLLSSADAQFASYMGFVNEWVKKLFSTDLFGKFVVFFLLSIGTVAAVLAWARPFPHTDPETETKRLDPIVAGIVLGGVLALYALFLWIQVGNMWVGKLPVEFSETERLVKDGFWQLLSLTVINILFTLATYRKTVPAVQRLLIVFAVASLLLLASAGLRMGLYVTYYGLSYEKFFASYTVLFCAILLFWLVSRLFARGRADIVRFPAMLFLWMFAVLTLMPVEQIIMRSNVALSRREGSRIHLFELTMLSPDVLGLVRKYQKEGVLKDDWSTWIDSREKIVSEKRWYEKNLMNLALDLRAQP